MDGPTPQHCPELGPCWSWKYGRRRSTVNVNRSNLPRPSFGVEGRTYMAARLMWMLVFGAIPEGLLVCHKCDNGQCVNPYHLFLDTETGNHQDWLKKLKMFGRPEWINGAAIFNPPCEVL